jgi:alcohol dehydrogenase class IV
MYPLLKTTELNLPRRIILGLNSIEKLAKEVKLLGGDSKILILTDRWVRGAGAPDMAVAQLKNEGLTPLIFDDIEPEPKLETIEHVANFARNENFEIIIGIGGGSVMDTAKLVAVSITDSKSVGDLMGFNTVKRRGVPTICVPTTSGTGSEASQYALATIGGKKRFCTSPFILPDVALLDPMLTISMPKNLTAGSGMDALAHAVESVISLEATPTTDALAHTAIRLVFKYLRRAYYRAEDIEARYNMSLAATLAGICLCNGKMVVGHSISQTLGPYFRIPHGMINAMTLPYVMKFYAPISGEKLKEVLSETGEGTQNLSVEEAAILSAKAVKRLACDVGVPSSLSEVKVTSEDLPGMAEAALNDFPRPNSPIALDKDRILKILEWMYKGDL